MPKLSPLAGSMLAMLIMMSSAPAADAQFLPHYDDVRVTTLTYHNTSGERGSTVFDYGWNGRLRHAVWALEDGSRFSGNYHLYDKQGREVEKYREFSDGLTSTETFTYDEQDRRISETFGRSDGVEGRAGFVWNEDDQLVATTCDNYKGWFSGRISYRYENGRRVGAEIERDGEVIGTITYSHDGGHLVEETWDFGGRWGQTFGYIYEAIPTQIHTFSSPLVAQNSRYVVAAENYDWNGESGGPSDYTYDDDRLTGKVFTRSDGLQTVTTFTYDDSGDLAASHRLYNDGQTADFTYVFDTDRRLAQKTFVHSDGRSGHEVYAYDRLGRLTGIEYENMDFWLNGTITLEHDVRGYVTDGHFAGRDGYDAELEIDTDEHGNVTHILWTFGFGKTQTYTFEYRGRGK